jgi:uncharacterized protein (DUF1501 family)
MSPLSRRDWLRLSAAGVVAHSFSGWLGTLAARAASDPQRRRSCILLWMHGGPSQMDTFDLKPGHANGGPFKEIATSIPGIRISEHLPRVAKLMDRLAILRSMTSKEGDHGRAAFHMKTGYIPQGPVHYPPLGSLLAKELGQEDLAFPGFVSIAPTRTLTPSVLNSGFLAARYAPLVVGDTAGGADPARALTVPDLLPSPGIQPERAVARIRMLRELQHDFLANHGDAPLLTHQAAVEGAVKLMALSARKAFDLDEEPAALRDAYGRNLFGQGCLLARRLVERGVPFVEVTLGSSLDGTSGWDTHYDNFDTVPRLCSILDPAWSTLMTDLKQRGLLDSTLIVWMGEFGRTPKINTNKGRDHFPNAWSAVLGGGGIKGGQVVGKTSGDGSTVEERPIAVADLLATVCRALGVDPTATNESNVGGRPIRIVDKSGHAVREVLS